MFFDQIKDEDASKCGYVASLSVASNYRRLHLGSLLLHTFEQKVKEKGCVSLSLHASATNKPAVSLYTKNGFEVYDRLDDYYGKDEHGYEMVKRLDQHCKQHDRFDLKNCFTSLFNVVKGFFIS